MAFYHFGNSLFGKLQSEFFTVSNNFFFAADLSPNIQIS